MEKKATIISLIAIAIIVVITSLYIVLSGITTKDYNYVQLEVNPRIEFVLDKKFDVVSVSPLNDDARIVLSDLDLVGLDIEEASNIFLDECAKTGFIDVNGIDNATNITVIDGLTQALDTHTAKGIYKYYRDNEIMSAITETDEDRDMFNAKIKDDVCCSNKLKLLQTMTEKNKSIKFEDIKKLNEATLVEMVAEEHKLNPFVPTEEELNKKQELISDNADKYSTHKKCISKFSQREFSELFDKHQKLSTKKYLAGFDEQYNNWQKQYS